MKVVNVFQFNASEHLRPKSIDQIDIYEHLSTPICYGYGKEANNVIGTSLFKKYTIQVPTNNVAVRLDKLSGKCLLSWF